MLKNTIHNHGKNRIEKSRKREELVKHLKDKDRFAFLIRILKESEFEEQLIKLRNYLKANNKEKENLKTLIIKLVKEYYLYREEEIRERILKLIKLFLSLEQNERKFVLRIIEELINSNLFEHELSFLMDLYYKNNYNLKNTETLLSYVHAVIKNNSREAKFYLFLSNYLKGKEIENFIDHFLDIDIAFSKLKRKEISFNLLNNYIKENIANLFYNIKEGDKNEMLNKALLYYINSKNLNFDSALLILKKAIELERQEEKLNRYSLDLINRGMLKKLYYLYRVSEKNRIKLNLPFLYKVMFRIYGYFSKN